MAEIASRASTAASYPPISASRRNWAVIADPVLQHRQPAITVAGIDGYALRIAAPSARPSLSRMLREAVEPKRRHGGIIRASPGQLSRPLPRPRDDRRP